MLGYLDSTAVVSMREDLQSTKSFTLAGIWGPQVVPRASVGEINQHEAKSSPQFAGVVSCLHPAYFSNSAFHLPAKHLLSGKKRLSHHATISSDVRAQPDVSWKKNWLFFPPCTPKKQHRARHPTQMFSKAAQQTKLCCLSQEVREPIVTHLGHVEELKQVISWNLTLNFPPACQRCHFRLTSAFFSFSSSSNQRDIRNHSQAYDVAYVHENSLLHRTKLGGTKGQASSTCQRSKAFQHT